MGHSVRLLLNVNKNVLIRLLKVRISLYLFLKVLVYKTLNSTSHDLLNIPSIFNLNITVC